MALLDQDSCVIRELAKQLWEIAESERHAVLRREWTMFNDLQQVAPRVLIYPDGDGALSEILGDMPLACSDPELRELEYIVDEDASARKRDKIAGALDGILSVEMSINYSVLVASLVQDMVHLRSMEDLYIDLYDHPDWLHAILSHMAESKRALLLRLEKKIELVKTIPVLR
jgi:hypothetical protein